MSLKQVIDEIVKRIRKNRAGETIERAGKRERTEREN